jgi:demethylsterigmatocystin 6-O-methyltransferase
MIGADIYLLHNILHDWPDSKCLLILQNIATAMSRNSRLLIMEYVVPETGFHWLTASLDLCMCMFFSGIERTLVQWETFFDEVGLEIVKVWPNESGTKECVIELRKRKCS